jgi:hypothetical protein
MNAHATTFLAWIDARHHVLPDGSLMRPSEIGMRVDKPTSLVRHWLMTHRPEAWAEYEDQRDNGHARRLRKAFADMPPHLIDEKEKE